MATPFLVIWSFQVSPQHRERFMNAYSPRGDWAQLFSRSEGYQGTRLLQDTGDSDRFITIDQWQSETHLKQFKTAFDAEYQQLDKTCEGFTLSETRLL